MSRKYIRSSRPFFPDEDTGGIISDIAETLRDGRLRNGKNLLKFEGSFAEYVGTKEAIAFDSDSDALETALHYYHVKDCEVIVCTNSFISIPNSVIYAGGKVVFADIREDTLSMNPNSLSENISENTCGVIVTHIAGFPNPDLKEIIDICKRHNLFLFEDATHAVGATINGRKVGTFSEAAVFAFTPTKVFTTGEGGMLVTNNEELGEEARRFRYYGSGTEKTSFITLGRHMMLPEISAILGIYQLGRVEEFISRRNEIAKIYNEEIKRMDQVRTVDCPSDSRCSYYKYPLILNDSINRLKLVKLLEKKYGIETGNVFYPPCHLQPVYQKSKSYSNKRGSLLVSERVLSQTITLPMHVAQTDEEAMYVTECLRSALAAFP